MTKINCEDFICRKNKVVILDGIENLIVHIKEI